MVGNRFFNIILIISTFFLGSANAQNMDGNPYMDVDTGERLYPEKGFGVVFQSLVLFPTNFDDTPDSDSFDINQVWGFNTTLKYAFDPSFQLSVTTGYEKISPNDISYVPLLFGVRIYTDETVKAAYVHADYGLHLREVDKPGYIFRAGLGYRFPVYKRLAGLVEFTFSMQDLQKNTENMVVEEKSFFIRSFGITTGFEIN